MLPPHPDAVRVLAEQRLQEYRAEAARRRLARSSQPTRRRAPLGAVLAVIARLASAPRAWLRQPRRAPEVGETVPPPA